LRYNLSKRITALLTVYKCARAKENNRRLLEAVNNESRPPRKKVVVAYCLLVFSEFDCEWGSKTPKRRD